MSLSKVEISQWFMDLQDLICKGVEDINGKTKFQEENWIRSGGDGGRTRVIQSERVIEKGGVNYSAVYGTIPEKVAQ